MDAISNPVGVDRQTLGLLGQDLLYLFSVAREVVDQVIPHLGLVFVLLVAVPSVIGDRERAARLEHKGNRALGDLHNWRCLFGGSFEFFIRDTVGDHYEELLVEFKLSQCKRENVLPHSKDTLPGLNSSERPA